MSGARSERLARSRVPRPLVLGAWMLLMLLAYLSLLLPPRASSLHLATVVVGGAYGAQACLMPVIASELYGNAHLPLIYPAINIAVGLGSY